MDHSKKPWYKTWWGVLILVLFWPFSLSYWIWNNNWSKNAKLGAIAVVWTIVAIAMIQNALTKPPVVAKPQEQPRRVVLPSPVAVQPEAVINPAPKPVTMLDNLWIVYDKVSRDRTGVDISYDEKRKIVSLAYGDKDSMFWNEKAIVEGMFAEFVQYGKQVFAIEGVEKLSVNVRAPVTDSYGKESVETVSSITMTKEEFQKYNWDQLRFQPIYYQMNRSAEKIYIAPAILKEIKLSEVKLTAS